MIVPKVVQRTSYGLFSVDPDYYEDPDRTALWRCRDGEPVELIGVDGGEPEDQTFGRDWCWVPGALQAAYDRGRNDG